MDGMLARRLLMFALILLVVTAISSAIAPPPRIATDAGAPSPTAGASTADATVVDRTVDARGEPVDVAVQAGDILRLTVESEETGAVELVGLGAIRAIAPGTPVTFDVLPRRSGEHPVVFEAAGGVERTVATVRVVSPEE